MKRRLPTIWMTASWNWLACCALQLSGPCVYADFAGRSTWVWDDVFDFLNDVNERDAALDFMQLKGIDTAYLWLDLSTLQNEPQKYRDTISGLHARGMQAYVLDGDPSFVIPGSARDLAIARFQSVLQYNNAAGPNERFDGAHFDNEPWALPTWNSNRAQTIQDYLSLSTEYFELRDAFASSIPIAADVPFVFAAAQFPEIANTPFNGETKILHKHVQDIFDKVTLLDYRDFALGIDSIEFHAQPWLEYGGQIGKPVEIGVETSPNPINKVTFDEEGAAFMETQLALAESQFLDDSAFDGFSIHHFGSYRSLVLSEAAQADFDASGVVDGADYAVWLSSLGQTGDDLPADANDDLVVDQVDYLIWKSNLGSVAPIGTSASLAVPEPLSLYLLFLAVGFGVGWRLPAIWKGS